MRSERYHLMSAHIYLTPSFSVATWCSPFSEVPQFKFPFGTLPFAIINNFCNIHAGWVTFTFSGDRVARTAVEGGALAGGPAGGAQVCRVEDAGTLQFASWTSSSAGVNYWEAPGSVSRRGTLGLTR